VRESIKRSKRKKKRDYDDYIFIARVFLEEEEEEERVFAEDIYNSFPCTYEEKNMRARPTTFFKN